MIPGFAKNPMNFFTKTDEGFFTFLPKSAHFEQNTPNVFSCWEHWLKERGYQESEASGRAKEKMLLGAPSAAGNSAQR
jgi:hypothetical protein